MIRLSVKVRCCFGLVLAALLVLASWARAGWVQVNLPEEVEGVGWVGLFSPDSALLKGALWGGRRYLLRTTDGFLSFTDVTSDSMPPGSLFTPGWGQTYIANQTRLARSRDFGTTWRTVYQGPSSYEPGCALVFVDSLHGFAQLASDAPFLRTTDGGLSWSELARPLRRMTSLTFVDSLQGWAVWDSGMCRTTDAGNTWQRMPVHRDTFFFEVRFFNARQGYAAGQKTSWVRNTEMVQEGVFRTDDGGNTWTQLFLLPKWSDRCMPQIDRFCPLNEQTVFVSSYDETGERARLYRTTNGHDFRRVALPLSRVWGVRAKAFLGDGRSGFIEVELMDGDGSYWRTADGGGESLGFWQPLAALPAKAKKGALLAYLPDPAELFVLEKGSGKLRSFDLTTGRWRERRGIPTTFKDGSMTSYEAGLVVARLRSRELWHYCPDADTWGRLPDVPGETLLKTGACITSDGPDPIFVLKGGKTREFRIYDAPSRVWRRGPDFPGTPVGPNAAIACDGDDVFVVPGNRSRECWTYSIAADVWRRLPDVPGVAGRGGTCLAANPFAQLGRFVLLKGASNECWSFDLNGTWQLQPGLPGRSKVRKGAQLVADDADIYYALRSANKPDIWQNDNFVPPEFGSPARSGERPAAQARESAPTLALVFEDGELRLPPGRWSALVVYDVTGRTRARFRNPAGGSAYDLGSLPRAGLFFAQLVGPERTLVMRLPRVRR